MSGFAAIKVEIAFDSNFTTAAASRTWVDISDRVDGPVDISWGRADQLSSVEPSSCSVVLENINGDFTAQNTGSAYYPNVKLDRPLRVTVTPAGGTASVRFVGYVDAWPVSWPGGTDTYAQVTITATSRTGRLGLRNALQAMPVESALSTSAQAIYPLHDASGSTSAEDISGNHAAPLAVTGAGAPVSFGSDGVEFAGGEYLTGGAPLDVSVAPAVSFACTFVTTTVPGLADPTLWGGIISSAPSGGQRFLATYADGLPHRCVVTRSSGGVVSAWVDGVATTAPSLGNYISLDAGVGFVGTLRDLAYWTTELSSGDVANDYVAFNGGFNETSDAAFVRLAGYAGVPSAEVDADAGVVAMGGIDTAGMAAVDALRVVETTEGGVLVDARNGDLRLIGRRARFNSASVLTLDMSAQEVEASYAPTLDRSLLRNDVTGTNAASSVGSIDAPATVSKRATNDTSIAEYGTRGASVEVAAADDNEAYAAASWIVANFGEPSLRVPSLSMEFTALTLAKQQAALSVFVGDRVTLTNRPTQDSVTEAEFFVEGGTESWDSVSGSLTWNVSPIGLEDSVLKINGGSPRGYLNSGNYIGY